MSYSFFDGSKIKTGRASLEARVSVNKNGRISFNKKFREDYIKDNQYVLLGYNPKNKKEIVIKLSKTNEDNKGISIKENKNNIGINTGSLLREITDLEKVYGSYSVSVDKDGLILFNLIERKVEKNENNINENDKNNKENGE